MTKISSDIPIPQSTRGRPTVYPWATLKPGESFVIPSSGGTQQAYSRSRAHPGEKYTTRKEGDGVRVWRTA